MKKLFTLLSLLLFLSFPGFSDPVDTNTARLVAKNFILHQNVGNNTLQAQQLDLACIYTTKEKNLINQDGITSSPLFYIYNVRGNQGFVIISADNDAIPVLGYSTEGNYTGYNMPNAFEKLLEKYRQEIKYIKQNSLEADETIVGLWEDNISGSYVSNFSTNAVSALVPTKWNQSPNYNALCPYDNAHSERTVTGCVATAMAQIMKFWNAPAQGSGFHSYNHSTYGTLSANFGSTTYNWAGMPNTVSSANNAVATLMYHVGVSVEMDYGPGSTGGSAAYVISSASASQACSEYALKTYFGYATSMQGLERANYTDAVWIQKLKTELDAGRPILYTGFGQGGHAFVCDGYDNSSNFHFNWGWGGMYDGYFNINSLNPGTGGAGSGAGTYNNGQQALLGIKPITGGGGNALLKIYSSISVSQDPIQYASSFNVEVDIANSGTSTFTGEFTAAVFNKQGAFIDFVDTKTGVSLPNLYYNTYTFNTTGMVSVTPGDYTIEIFYKSSTGNWTIVPAGSYSNAVDVTVEGPANDISMYDSIQVTPNPMLKGQSATLSTKIANYGSSSFYGDLLMTLNNLDGSFVQALDMKTGVTLANGFYNTYTFNSASLDSAAGTYLLVVWDKPSGGSWNLLASNAAKFGINPVQIRVVESAITPDAYEQNNTDVTAYSLPVSFSGNTAQIITTGSNIHVGNDIDYYKVVLPPGSSYTITARVHDAYNSGNGNTYTADVVFDYNDGTAWSDSYDDVMSSNIVMSNGGTLKLSVAPYFSGNTGTYLLDINISKTSGAPITVTSPVTGNSWQKTIPQTITWTDNISENVIIELFKGSSSVLTINTSVPSNGTYGWTPSSSLVADIDYRIKITSITDNLVNDFSDYFTIAEKSVSINENPAKNDLVNFYPNPASSYLNIQALNKDMIFDHIKITNCIGELVYDQSQPLNSRLNRLDISALLPGVYYLTLSGKQKTVDYRFSIVK